jgi:hypothetical protein
MMKHEEIKKLLEDYLDGTLDADHADRVEAHLEGCVDCRDEVKALRALLAEAEKLPRSIEPPRDLWPEVDARLDAPDDVVAGMIEPSGGLRSRSVWSLRYPLAAAAVVLMVVSSAVTALIVGNRPPELSGMRPAPGGVATVSLISEWQSAEEEYLRATAELTEALEVTKGGLDPEVVRVIEENLRIIDAAIQESRAALALDSSNRELVEMLAARYETKLEVLQQVNRISAEL